MTSELTGQSPKSQMTNSGMNSIRSAAATFAVAAAFSAIYAGGTGAQTRSADGNAFAGMLDQARVQDWEAARLAAEEFRDPVAVSIVDWLRLREGSDSFDEYLRFLEGHSDWPGLKILRRSGEKAIDSDADPRSVMGYFSEQRPQTGKGALALAEALLSLGRRAEAEEAIADGWLSLPFEADVQAEALSKFGGALGPVHLERLDNLLWQSRFEEAERMSNLIGSGWSTLASARRALKEEHDDVNARIAAIPAELVSHSGLAHDRVVWRLRNGEEDRGASLLISQSSSQQSLGKPAMWAPQRISLAHGLMLEGANRLAYEVASSHHMLPSPNLLDWLSAAHREREERAARARQAELEWLSGYISLRKLSNPQVAAGHFEKFRTLVATPISISKADYWLGVSLSALGDGPGAAAALGRAAQVQTSFYGQLAAQLTGTATDAALLGSGQAQEVADSFAHVPVVRAGLLFHYAGEDSRAAWFLSHWAEELSGEDISALAALAQRHGAEFSAIKVAKEGVKNGHADIDHLFPLTGIESFRLSVPSEMAISVARQETEFRDRAVSPKGAVGVMQIKPSTGREVAEGIGLTGNIGQMLRSRETNVQLGAAYLRERLNEFTGSYVLAIAAYNAGPRRVNEWLESIGDPRDPQVNPVDWIEHIPYGETRNYVMRVIEAMIVYRMRITQIASPIDILSYLQSG